MSFFHSGVYLALLICAFVLGNPEPATFILGLAHGLLWIGMSLRLHRRDARCAIIPFWLAVTVAVLGGLGPFFGSIGFIVAEPAESSPDANRARVTVDAIPRFSGL